MRHRDLRTGRYACPPLPPPAPDPLAFPTEKAPRFRLRVFDQRWPWRRSRDEVLDDAIASGNGRVDPETRHRYMTVPAMVQRDPPGFRQPVFRDCTDQARADRERRG